MRRDPELGRPVSVSIAGRSGYVKSCEPPLRPFMCRLTNRNGHGCFGMGHTKEEATADALATVVRSEGGSRIKA